MFHSIFKRCACALLAASVAIALFAIGTAATTRIRPSYSREAEISENQTGMGTDSSAGGGMNSGSMNSGSDSTSAPGTGEFGDDTSNNSSGMGGSASNGTSNDTSNDTSRNTADKDTTRHDETGSLDSSLDGVVNDAEDTAGSMRNGMGVWGIVIVILIVAAIAALVFAFFTKKK